MSRILIISGHPDLQQSWTNRLIINTLEQEVSDLNVRRLDQRYPDFNIDVASEQQALLDAEIVVLQFPFYWYSVPALLKQWLDDNLPAIVQATVDKEVERIARGRVR